MCERVKVLSLSVSQSFSHTTLDEDGGLLKIEKRHQNVVLDNLSPFSFLAKCIVALTGAPFCALL